MRASLLVPFVLAVAARIVVAEDCNHQRKSYDKLFSPISLSGKDLDGVQVTPYFSPLHSLSVLTDLINNAKQSIDIMTPHWKSWIASSCDVEYGTGCPVSDFRYKEEFPIWAALLNANVRGVTVRILTNECFYKVEDGKVSTYGYLSLAGIQVRQFASLSFVHAKFIAIDGKIVSISSINFSESSFMKNREAGLILEGNDDLIQFFSTVFESDWEAGLDWIVNKTYSEGDLAIIQNKSMLPVNVPEPTLNCSYQDPVPKSFSADEIAATTGPDHAHDFVISGFNDTRKKLDVFVYEIGLHDAKDSFIELHSRGVTVRVLVSDNTIGSSSAASNYEAMMSAGIEVRTSASCYSFAHQKYWVIDGEKAFLATGNLDYSDYPVGSTFKVGSYAYRDFTVSVKGEGAVGVFVDLFEAEWANGKAWHK